MIDLAKKIDEENEVIEENGEQAFASVYKS